MFNSKFLLPLLAILMISPVALAGKGNWQAVQGTAIHYESEGIEHSNTPTATGYVRVSTDIVELEGDLVGRAVFQPVSEVNVVEGRIVNTGSQVFSGTVLNSDPVMLHDDGFIFRINMFTGETRGRIFLTDRIAGPVVRCILKMEGTGRTAEGYNLSNYWGRCKLKNNR